MDPKKSEEKRIIEAGENLSVGALASLLELPATTLIGELFKNGIVTTINQKIDADTAQIIIDELGLSVEIVVKDDSNRLGSKVEDETVNDELEEGADVRQRPPVIAVMGHVDHGKTTLLDRILGLKVADGEAGGITQHISAYQATNKDRVMTLLDTPGHEAFSALRQHGALLTDLAVIVVAADDGVKPQTLEAIRFAKEEGVKLLIAVTKIDKPDADLPKLKQQLVDAGVVPEEWGGDTVLVEVSAKTGKGMDDLMDMIVLMADVEDLKARYGGLAEGIVIEAHQEKGVGPLIKVLITKGVIKSGEHIVVGGAYGKVRTLKGWDNKALTSAGPSTPVWISGLKALPDFGDRLHSSASDKEARKAAQSFGTGSVNSLSMNSQELLRVMSHRNEISVMPIILKADVAGSLKSVSDSIQLVGTDEVEARLIGSGVGNITERDIMLATTSRATIYGFNVGVSNEVLRVARNSGVRISIYKIIYELIDDVKSNLENLLEPDIVDTPKGRLLVRGVFRTVQDEVVCGGEVTKGSVSVGFRAKAYRGDEEIAEVEISSVQEGKQEVSEVLAGSMCGLRLKTDGKVKIEEGDRLEIYKREVIEKTL
jgi:translation initiation factor IF-2